MHRKQELQVNTEWHMVQDVFPSLVGKTYGEARQYFDKAVLCGVLNVDTDKTQLNPSDSCILQSQHKLVFLSDTAHIKPSRQVKSESHKDDRKN